MGQRHERGGRREEPGELARQHVAQLRGVTRLVLLGTSPRVAPGLLSAEAWQALHAGPVFAADLDLPVAAVLNTAGVTVVTPRGAQAPTRSATELVDELIEAATSTGTVTWLIGSDGDQEFT